MEDRFIENFKNGFPFIEIVAAATPERGITVMSTHDQEEAVARYDRFSGSVLKFVPASGAASRMFRSLYEGRELLAAGRPLPEDSDARTFLSRIRNFAFYDESEFEGLDELGILDHVLGEAASPSGAPGLNYGNRPKGQVLFHRYGSVSALLPAEVRTAFEEHLVEGARYARQKDNVVRIHFTVSPQHEEGFRAILDELLPVYENRYACRYDISFSVQDPDTDIIAVNADNTPFLKADGKPLYRPGGHGALLKNLNALQADVIFLKNIDNVVHQSHLDETVRWKKILAGKLLEIRDAVKGYLILIDNLHPDREPDRDLVLEIRRFLYDRFCISMPSIPKELELSYLYSKLNRPIRVCGMVRNEGEPGGGPYIVYDEDRSTSLQILESAQLDRMDPRTAQILKSATHFNPVDIVCSTVDYRGRKFDLNRHVDPKTGFISEKTHEGRKLKAQELPGLWNGSMSDWNTVFVETPLITFNPVKTVLDLLRKEHCPVDVASEDR